MLTAQLSQRDRAAEYISFGQKWKTGTGRQYFTDIIGLSSTTVISASKAIEFSEKRKIRAITRPVTRIFSVGVGGQIH